jgi:gas vesicle protein
MAVRSEYEIEKSWFNTRNFLLGMLTGAVVGGVTAMLLTPKSGKETRQIITKRATDTQQILQSQMQEIRDRLGRAGQALRAKVEQEQQASGNGKQ